MKKFSLLESFKYSDEEIEDFFIEYIDADLFKLTTGFMSKDNRFFTDIGSVSKTDKQCKHIKITLEDIAEGKSIEDIDKLQKVITTLKSFYLRSGEQPNYKIETRWDDIEINFYVIGGGVESTHIGTKDTINTLQLELADILKKRGYKRVTCRGNRVEVRTPKNGNDDLALFSVLRRARENQLGVDTRNQPLIDWIGKINQAGFEFDTSGGDNQVIIKLKPQI